MSWSLARFQELNGLVPLDSGKVAEKGVEGVAILDVVEQGLNRNTGARKARGAVHDSGIDRNHSCEAGFLFSGHTPEIGHVRQLRKPHHFLTDSPASAAPEEAAATLDAR
jgi:hypothetical protein